MSRTLFYKPRTQLFGSRLSPVNFARMLIWTYKVMTVLFLVAMSSCVDDVLCVERTATITSAYRCWRKLCELLGWDVPDSKSPPPTRAFRVLGVWLDFTATPRGGFCNHDYRGAPGETFAAHRRDHRVRPAERLNGSEPFRPIELDVHNVTWSCGAGKAPADQQKIFRAETRSQPSASVSTHMVEALS